MGLACSQIRLLTLTRRKADCELGISVDSMQKMALTREMSQLSQDYYSKLKAKNITYFANGKYNKMNYQYLMGRGANYSAILNTDKYALKSENSMILADYKGQVVLSDDYANAITSVLGSSAMDKNGRGGTFSQDKIYDILASLLPGNNVFSANTLKKVHEGGQIDSQYAATVIKTLTGESTETKTVVENTKKATELLNKIIDFYYPIFQAAASNGWTSEYNKDMACNDNYVSDALQTGSFQLETVDKKSGEYDEGGNLTYFITKGLIAENNNSDAREEVTAWYNAEKERITEKENYIDLDLDNLSTELETINTEIQSVQSLIDDAISSVFDWGSG